MCIFQQKYFDSGDYAMAKAKTGALPVPVVKGGVPVKGKFLPPGPTTGMIFAELSIYYRSMCQQHC